MEAIEDPTTFQKRFKGVENFLRRIAYNLGNTPSQTEVKIISCIPIDVTDLQQKIIQLEKKLEEAKPSKGTKDSVKDVRKDGKDLGKDAKNPNDSDNCHDCTNPASTVHTTLFSSHFPRFTTNICKGIECNQSNQAIQCDNLSNKRNKSTVSFLLSNSQSNRAVNMSSEKSALTSEKRSQTILNEFRRKFTKKKKYKRQKVETQLVYYAQTDNVLCNSNKLINDGMQIHAPYKGLEAIDRPYLSNVLRKQYKAGPVAEELSDNTLFSSPICRDYDQTWQKSRPYESDICSCCHENFHNVDHYITSAQANEYSGLNFNTSPTRNAYYDSSLYDLIPVKETPVRTRKEWKDFDVPKRRENKTYMKCRRETTKPKTRCSTVIANYHTVTPARKIYPKKYAVKTAKRDSDPRLIITQDKRILKLNQQTGMESSKSCCVDLGDFYPKALQRNKPIILPKTSKPPLKNAECFTDPVPKVDCQTTTAKIDEKTEMTLNQIKNILQSVLVEVKTNIQPKDTNNNTKKDAIIQKGASQGNILEGSNFLNSFTYSPYNINPYGPSCSKNMPSNYFCQPVMPQSMRCMQNYPLIIQTPGRQMCTGCCYRSSQNKSYLKNATTATITKEKEERGKETEKLIQEIYKSVALGMSGRNTSRSECDDLKSAKTTSNKSKEVSSNETKMMISEIFRNNDVQVNTSDTHNTNTTIFYRNRKDMSTRSHSLTTEPSIDHRINTKKDEASTQQSTETEPEAEKRKYPRRVVKTTNRCETISESSDTESSSTESDTDVTTVSIKKPEKKKSGLMSKVFNLFNRKKKKDAKHETEVQSESSDSDYQTIYSQKINPPKRTEHRTPRSRAHSKLHSRRAQPSQRSPERPKRNPYMEQEYRRLWNEKLTFQNNRPRYSSERPATWQTNQRARQRPVYYQNYEARSVLVDPRQYQPRYDVINGKPCLAEVNAQRRPYAQPYSQNVLRVEQGTGPVQPALNTVRRNTTQYVAPRNVGNANRTLRVGMSWLKNQKLRRCGEQWKKILIES